MRMFDDEGMPRGLGRVDIPDRVAARIVSEWEYRAYLRECGLVSVLGSSRVPGDYHVTVWGAVNPCFIDDEK